MKSGLTIAGLMVFASTVDWLADCFFRILGGVL